MTATKDARKQSKRISKDAQEQWISKADDKMDAQCEWCPHVCTQAKPRCNMMAGYAEAQMRERLAYACNCCNAYQTLDDRIVGQCRITCVLCFADKSVHRGMPLGTR